ncbi:MAG TPA: hypothetical protein VK023_11765 [Sphingobacterium bovisgrunnientis]|jgi:hypothetical protein|nr:hypothetical protein [Sphingobacterium bovisgrunnientis]
MDYLYKTSELQFIRYLKEHQIHKIWWDFTTYIFDYGDFYFQIESVSAVEDTPNESDEAIIGQFTKHLVAFVPGEHTRLVCQDKKIEELYIVRIFLYFTNLTQFTKTEQLLRRVKQKLRVMASGKKDPIGDITSKTTGVHKEITCHPKLKDIINIDAKYSNIIDCGILIKIDGKYLKAFVQSNSFGFAIWDDEYFYNEDLIKDLSEEFELIKI